MVAFEDKIEQLLAWHQEQFGVVTPGEYFPQVEEELEEVRAEVEAGAQDTLYDEAADLAITALLLLSHGGADPLQQLRARIENVTNRQYKRPSRIDKTTARTVLDDVRARPGLYKELTEQYEGFHGWLEKAAERPAYVAVEGGDIQAVAIMKDHTDDDGPVEGPATKICTLFVLPGSRGRGYGKRLLRIAEWHARKAGNSAIWGTASTEEVRQFFTTHGWSVDGDAMHKVFGGPTP